MKEKLERKCKGGKVRRDEGITWKEGRWKKEGKWEGKKGRTEELINE